MQFHFPQYIDIEDKLFGPLTLKQAIFVAGGIGGAYVAFTYIPYIAISAPIIAGIGALTWALAFYPKEKLGRPFIEVLEAGFNYAMRDKLYTWKKTTKEPKLGKEEGFLPAQAPLTPAVSTGKLASSSFALDVKGPADGSDREEAVTLKGRGGNGAGGIMGATSAEAGTLSADSFVLTQKIPKVDTFVSPEKTEHSPYKVAGAPQGGAGGAKAGGAPARMGGAMARAGGAMATRSNMGATPIRK